MRRFKLGDLVRLNGGALEALSGIERLGVIGIVTVVGTNVPTDSRCLNIDELMVTFPTIRFLASVDELELVQECP